MLCGKEREEQEQEKEIKEERRKGRINSSMKRVHSEP